MSNQAKIRDDFLSDNGEDVGYRVELENGSIVSFIQLRRLDKDLQIWISHCDFSQDENPANLGFLLNPSQARNLAISLIEQAFFLEKKLIESGEYE